MYHEPAQHDHTTHLAAPAALVGALVVALGSCGKGGGGINEDDLVRPAYVASRDNGLCRKVLAVDGERRTWAEEGCENYDKKLSASGRVSTEEWDSVVTAYSALSACVGTSNRTTDGWLYAFRARLDTGDREWVGCVSQAGELEQPFADTWQLLERLSGQPETCLPYSQLGEPCDTSSPRCDPAAGLTCRDNAQRLAVRVHQRVQGADD